MDILIKFSECFRNGLNECGADPGTIFIVVIGFIRTSRSKIKDGKKYFLLSSIISSKKCKKESNAAQYNMMGELSCTVLAEDSATQSLF